MKKNKMMRLASILLVCVLLTTSVISGTFAKYTSTTNISDTARVAKWGWGDTKITLDLFDQKYAGTDGDTVQSRDDDNVIAPGTSKSAPIVWTAAASFQPEVDYKLTFAVNAKKLSADLEAKLDWTLKFEDGAEQTFATFGALQQAVAGQEVKGEAAAATPTVNVVIGWVWAFDGDDTSDTELGNAAQLDSLEIEAVLTATQVD